MPWFWFYSVVEFYNIGKLDVYNIDGQKAKCRKPHFGGKWDYNEVLNFII